MVKTMELFNFWFSWFAYKPAATITTNNSTRYSATINNLIIFGKYPSVTELEQWQKNGFTIVNLTNKLHKFESITYPIKDEGVPEQEFPQFVTQLCDKLQSNFKLFIHCDHGRGRSGLVTAAILGQCYGLSKNDALDVINKAHRQGHGQKWQRKDIPTHKAQKEFLQQYFSSMLR